MAINARSGPPGGIAAIGTELNHLLSRGPGSPAPRAGAEPAPAGSPPPRMSQPIPLYTIGLQDIHDSEFLTAAREIGWRYVIFAEGPIAVADVEETESPGKPHFRRLTRGPIAQRLVEAISLAEGIYRNEQSDYELRMLEIPALYTVALWLNGKQDAFIPIADGSPSLPEKIAVDADFLGKIFKQANSKRQRGEPLGAPL
jgi:hypothetical protein